MKKHHPLEYSHSIKLSQPPEDVRNKRFGGRVSALFRGPREFVKPEEGACDIIHEFQLDLQMQCTLYQ